MEYAYNKRIYIYLTKNEVNACGYEDKIKSSKEFMKILNIHIVLHIHNFLALSL